MSTEPINLADRDLTLMDGVAHNHASPDTFEIPQAALREMLKVGDHAKLGFRSLSEGGERMWVLITERIDGRYRGTLANGPVVVDLAFGDVIEFEPKHVLDTMETS